MFQSIIFTSFLIIFIIINAEAFSFNDPTIEHVKTKEILGIADAKISKIFYTDDDYIRQNLTLPLGIKNGSNAIINDKTLKILSNNSLKSNVELNDPIFILLKIYNHFSKRVDMITKLPFKIKIDSVYRTSDQGLNLLDETKLNICDYHNFIYISNDGITTTLTRLKNNFDETKVQQKNIKYHFIKNYKVILADSALLNDNIQLRSVARAYNIAEKVKTKRVLLLTDVLSENQRINIISILSKLDVIIMSEESAKKFTKTNKIDNAINKLMSYNKLIIISKDDLSNVIIEKNHIIKVDSFNQELIPDHINYQSAFAAGFLYGYLHNFSLIQSCNFGNKLAFKMITQDANSFYKSLNNIHNEDFSN